MIDRVPGVSVADTEAVDLCGVARRVLADRLLAAFLSQVMVSGVFHADPHPGNILIDGDGTLWLIDFGAVGLIDPVTMESLQLMVGAWPPISRRRSPDTSQARSACSASALC